jgi:N-acetylneuraminate lyase
VTFSGILPAIVTPLDENEEFLPKSFELLLERLYGAGAHGVYVSGQTGEGLLQPVTAREQVIEAAVKSSPKGKTVIAHVGAHRTADAIRLAKHASKQGAHAVSSLPPIGAYSYEEVKRYYAALAAASDVPLFVYYFPEFSQAIASLEAQRDLLSIPNVIGLKFTDFDLYRLSLLKRAGACVFNGHDEVLAAGLLMGADGGIGTFYNLVPELFVQVYDQARAGDWPAARATQDRINELIEITLRFPMLPAIKTMLTWSGIACGPCLKPRRALSADEESGLAELLSASSFAGAAFATPRCSKPAT